MTELKDHHADITAIKALIQKFFDAINSSKPKALEPCFASAANLTIIRQEPPRVPNASYHPTFASIPLPAGVKSGDTAENQGSEDKLTIVMRTTIEKFIALLLEGEKHRKPGGPVLFEAPDLQATEVRIDGLFGTAWSPFRVTFDGVLHHYGTMAYTLGKVEGGWVIEGLTQSYRRAPGWEEKPPGSVL